MTHENPLTGWLWFHWPPIQLAHDMDRGAEVHIVENRSREGTQLHLDWLNRQGRLVYHDCDIRDLHAAGDLPPGSVRST